MARISEARAGGANFIAFLDMLAWSEGTSISPHTRDDGYDVIVGGLDSPNRFSGYAEHPRVMVRVNARGLRSTAAGRYQFLARYWQHYREALALPDFSPVSQDRWALQLIRECRANRAIELGDIAEAIRLCANIWASLPGNNYGQPMHHRDKLIAKYREFGGSVKP